MAANNGGSNSTGREIYYNVSYGMLCTNEKTAPEGYEIIELSDIKSRRQKNENVDLRNRFYDTKSDKAYPLKVFYTDIDGVIESVEKEKYSQGISLKVTLHDDDGDQSVITTDFYSKNSADFLNRLLSVDPSKQLNFRPYSIPSSFESNGENINFYNSGVSIKDGGVKIDRKYKGKDSGLPRNERITNAKGEEETSRVAQINFLWEKVEAKFADINADSAAEVPAKTEDATPPKVSTSDTKSPPASAKKTTEPERDDLPF